MNLTGRVKFRWIFLIILLTRNSPYLPKKGILKQIFGEPSTEMSVPPFSNNRKSCSFIKTILGHKFSDIYAICLFSNVELLEYWNWKNYLMKRTNFRKTKSVYTNSTHLHNEFTKNACMHAKLNPSP